MVSQDRRRTVIRFLRVIAIFSTCTVVCVNGTLVEAKMSTFTIESTHFVFNKCPIYTHDGASAKFSTNSHETDYSASLCDPLVYTVDWLNLTLQCAAASLSTCIQCEGSVYVKLIF